ncbi:MAG: hypothetical protein GU362_05985 [Thaumarchaeota archaeon]|jgi:hypothetical protein|nr:hypothetical protein [Nitrososphaerota archaeon]
MNAKADIQVEKWMTENKKYFAIVFQEKRQIFVYDFFGEKSFSSLTEAEKFLEMHGYKKVLVY